MNLHCKEHPEQTEFYKIRRVRTLVTVKGNHISKYKRKLKPDEHGVLQTLFICPICADLIEIIPSQNLNEEPRWMPLKRIR